MVQEPTIDFAKVESFRIALEASICQDSLYQFVRMSFHAVEQDEFADGWHIRAICTYLENVYNGVIDRQIINIPIGHMKSLLVNVFFPAWVWSKSPDKKFIFLSYGEDLVIRDTAKCKRLMQSQWYQERFTTRLSTTPDTTTKFATADGGWRYAYGFGGAFTGQHADYVCIDDPLKASEADSKASREKVNKDFDDAVYNRIKPNGAMIIIMQRLHENDLCGHILEKKIDFEWLILPAEYEGVQRFQSSIGFTDPRTEAGELLWEARYDKVKIDDLKSAMSARGVAGQLQQRPAPLEGNTFKRVWFEKRYASEDIRGIYVSVDTAFETTEAAAKSAITVWGLTAYYQLIPLFAWADKVEFPQLVEKIVEIAERFMDRLYAIVVENKASASSAMQTIRQSAKTEVAQKLISFNPPANMSKDERAVVASTWCENESVILPPVTDENKEWLVPLEEELFMHPNGRYKDMVDTVVQLIFKLEKEALAYGLQHRRQVGNVN